MLPSGTVTISEAACEALVPDKQAAVTLGSRWIERSLRHTKRLDFDGSLSSPGNTLTLAEGEAQAQQQVGQDKPVTKG